MKRFNRKTINIWALFTYVLMPLGLLSWCVYLKIVDRKFYQWLIREDSLFEWLQCGLYFGAALISIFCTYLLIKNGDRLLSFAYALLGIGLVFIAGEEVSWGHSMLHLTLPSYFKDHNIQGDLTIHNLDTFQPYLHNAYILVSIAATFGWLLAKLLLKNRWQWEQDLLLPSWKLSLYFLPVGLFYLFVEHIGPTLVNLGYSSLGVSFNYKKTFLLFKDQEAVELLLAAGFCLFVLHTLFCLRKTILPNKSH